jgi:hypothetical protein
MVIMEGHDKKTVIKHIKLLTNFIKLNAKMVYHHRLQYEMQKAEREGYKGEIRKVEVQRYKKSIFFPYQTLSYHIFSHRYAGAVQEWGGNGWLEKENLLLVLWNLRGKSPNITYEFELISADETLAIKAAEEFLMLIRREFDFVNNSNSRIVRSQKVHEMN